MHLSPITRRASRGEGGFALITSVLVMMVATGLVIASLALAVHDSSQSGLTRNRTAAQHAAEAGLHDELTCLASPTGPVTAGGCGGATGASAAVCTSPLTKTLDGGLPVESYSVTVSGCGGATLTVVATGSVTAASGAATSTTRTVVANVTLVGSGNVSAGTSGGYPLTDAIMSFSGGAASSYSNLVVTGGTAIPNVHIVNGSSQTASFTNGALFGSLKVDAGGVALTNTTPVGGDIVVNGGVTLAGVNVQGNVVSASGTVSLTHSLVNQDVRTAAATVTNTSSTINGRTLTNAATTLPAAPPLPTFTYNASNWTDITGGSPTLSCPSTSTWSGTYYAGGGCTLGTPTTMSSTTPVAIIAAGNITMAVPPAGSGQLYLISTGGSVTITGNGSAVGIFAYGKTGVTTTGNLSGQLVGAPVLASNGTLTFAPPATAPPNFGLGSTTLATQVGYVPIVNYECITTGTATTC